MKSYYVAGGTMLVSDASYVVRDADYILRDRLVDGDFCYVLTPRQMGKSSLMVQTAHALRDQGIASVTLDLSKHGYTLDAGQWYDGLLEMIGYGLGLEDEIDKLIRESADLSPLQRWQKAIRNVVLERVSGPVVLFLDEIDITRRFSFETDEFFAAIRACYNQRAEEPAFRRLTFCLIGVATPADLIRDPLLTPFNIGTRIDLTDFTRQEASQLRLWLGKGESINAGIMDRIYYWANGHPYLTQRLCKAVAEDASIVSSPGVDQCCRNLFFTANVGTSDDNLAFVRNWMIPEDDEQRTLLLTLYGKVLAGKRVADSDTDANIARLKLCGAVRNVKGRLAARNRIYSTAFDTAWIKDNMPGQELIRQRRAYIAGVLRVLVPAVITLAFISLLAFAAFRSASRAIAAESRSRRLLYDMDMYQAGESWVNGATALTKQLLEYHSLEPHEFAWNYLNTQRNADFHRIISKSVVFHVAYSPNGRLVAAAYLDGTVGVWDAASFTPVLRLPGPGAVLWISFSPNSQRIATASSSAKVRVWNLQTGNQMEEFNTGRYNAQSGATCVAFSPVNSDLLAAGDATGRLWVCDLSHNSVRAIGKSHDFTIHGIAFDPDGTHLAVTGNESREYGTLEVWNTQEWKRTTHRLTLSALNSPAYSPDSKLLAVTQADGVVSVLSAKTLKPDHSFVGFKDMADGVAFSHDGKILAAAGWDNTIRLWSVKDCDLLEEIKGCRDRTTSVDFSADDRAVVSGDAAGDVKFWKVADKRRKQSPIVFGAPFYSIALSPIDPLIAVGSGDRITIWNSQTQELVGKVLDAKQGNIVGIEFSRDGRYLFSAGQASEVRRWDVRTHDAVLPTYSVPTSSTPDAIALSSDGVLLAAAVHNAKPDSSGSIFLWDVENPAKKIEIRMANTPRCLAFSPAGDKLVTGDDNHTIQVWDTKSGRLLKTFAQLQTNVIRSVAWSPDGSTIATTCWDKTVRLWDAKSCQSYALIQGHNGDVDTCCFSNDSQYLITAAADNKIKYWDIKLARDDPKMVREMLTLLGHKELVRRVIISSDSRLVVSQDEHTVRFWRADAQ